jgi:hypothetical protein
MKYGIDVSMFVNVDLAAYKVDFVIIRSGEGSAKDEKADAYIKEAKRLGIPWGIYHVLRLGSIYNNVANASDVIRRHGIPPMGVWCDVETPDAFDDEAINEFCAQMEKLGAYAGIYAGLMDIRTGKVGCPKYDKWVAWYGTETGYLHDFSEEDINIVKGVCHLWQYYGSKTGPDKNVCFLDDLSIFDRSKEKEDAKNDFQDIASKIDDIIKQLQDLKEAVTNET